MESSTTASAPHYEDESIKRLSLTTLPAELRNRIYELCLIDQHDIPLSKRAWLSHQPPLLRTCRQIRNDATKLFYSRNRFSIRIEHYNPAPCIRFWELQRRYGFRGNHRTTFAGRPNWEALLHWLRMVYLKNCVEPASCDFFKPVQEVIIENMFALVREPKELGYVGNWEELVDILEMQRNVLIAMDRRWSLANGRERARIRPLKLL